MSLLIQPKKEDSGNSTNKQKWKQNSIWQMCKGRSIITIKPQHQTTAAGASRLRKDHLAVLHYRLCFPFLSAAIDCLTGSFPNAKINFFICKKRLSVINEISEFSLPPTWHKRKIRNFLFSKFKIEFRFRLQPKPTRLQIQTDIIKSSVNSKKRFHKVKCRHFEIFHWFPWKRAIVDCVCVWQWIWRKKWNKSLKKNLKNSN